MSMLQKEVVQLPHRPDDLCKGALAYRNPMQEQL